MKDVEIVAICDQSIARMEEACNIIREKGRPTPMMTTNYRDIIRHPSIDAVIIMIGWKNRPRMAMESMRAGKYTAIEVGCADTLQECYDLVSTYEETGIPVMMLENCCYGRREMLVLNMVKQGLFGDIVHCTGGYHHYLNDVLIHPVSPTLENRPEQCGERRNRSQDPQQCNRRDTRIDEHVRDGHCRMVFIRKIGIAILAENHGHAVYDPYR
jgi:predicted dehydrogenase